MPELRFQTVLWDLDGTIADTHHLIHHCLDYSLNVHIGRGMSREVWEQWIGVPLRDLFPIAYSHHELPPPDSAAVASLTQCYRARLAEVDADVQMFPGVEETLKRLRSAGVRMGVVTTKHRRAMERTLDNLGISGLFDVLVAGDDCATYKPDPAPFLLACERMNLAPSECAAVGDSTADVLGAKASGIYAVAALWGAAGIDKVLSAGPNFAAHRPEDVMTVISAEPVS